MQDNYNIENPTIHRFVKCLTKELLAAPDGEVNEDLDFSLCRLEDEKQRHGNKVKLVCIDDLNTWRAKGWVCKEGYWTINNKAHYIMYKD